MKSCQSLSKHMISFDFRNVNNNTLQLRSLGKNNICHQTDCWVFKLCDIYFHPFLFKKHFDKHLSNLSSQTKMISEYDVLFIYQYLEAVWELIMTRTHCSGIRVVPLFYVTHKTFSPVFWGPITKNLGKRSQVFSLGQMSLWRLSSQGFWTGEEYRDTCFCWAPTVC